jgi:arylsulfatase
MSDNAVAGPLNVLLIATDQQRGDCLGIAGHPVLQTPNMDWIGASGTHFQRAYSECPSCLPARRTLMSGLAPAAHGMVGFQGSVPFAPPATVAGCFADAGYETRMIGKLHLHPHRKRFGFDVLELADSTRGSDNEYLDWLGGDAPHDRGAMAHGATPNGWIGRPNHLPEEQTHTFWAVSRAIEYLRKRDPACPFFLNVSFIDPHPPMTPPAWYFDRYAALELPPPAIGDWVEPFEGPARGIPPERGPFGQRGRLDADAMHNNRAAYFGMINHIDMQLGRLFQFLRDAKLLENTFILFVSDHGEMLGDHDMFSKCRALEGSARIPFVARAPQHLGYPREVVCDQPVGLQDVMPTLLDAAGLDIPAAVTGRSVVPLMHGDNAGWRSYLHGEHAGMYRYVDGNHYLVDARHKYIWFSQTGQELFFDLQRDPDELHDQSGSADLEPWRRRMVEQLRDRPEGFTDGATLISGRPHEHLVPTMIPPGVTVQRPAI